MGSDSGPVWISICGLIGIVGILIMLAALLLLRVLRFNLFGIVNMILRSVGAAEEEPDPLDNRERQQLAQRPRSRDLRAQADALDFDQAVAQKRGDSAPIIRTQTTLPPSLPPVSKPLDEPPPQERRRRPTDRRDDGLLDGIGGPEDEWL